MGYDRGDSFPFDFEPNGFLFGSKSKGKLSPRSDPIQFEGKWNTSFLSVISYADPSSHSSTLFKRLDMLKCSDLHKFNLDIFMCLKSIINSLVDICKLF